MPSGAMDLAKQFMRNPFTSLLKNDQLTLDGIKQFYVNVGNEAGKLLTMLELFPFLKEARGITFCNTRKGAELLAKQMAEKGHNISGMVCLCHTLPPSRVIHGYFSFTDRYNASRRKE